MSWEESTSLYEELCKKTSDRLKSISMALSSPGAFQVLMILFSCSAMSKSELVRHCKPEMASFAAYARLEELMHAGLVQEVQRGGLHNKVLVALTEDGRNVVIGLSMASIGIDMGKVLTDYVPDGEAIVIGTRAFTKIEDGPLTEEDERAVEQWKKELEAMKDEVQ